MIVPHRADGPIDLTVLCHGASQPEAQGLSGGYPSSVQVRLLLRAADLAAGFTAGRMPASIEEAGGHLVALAAKERTPVAPADAIVMMTTGGGGYGDPLKRQPDAVAKDVEAGLVSAAVARAVHGVVLDPSGAIDAAATETARHAIRQARLAEARPPASDRPIRRVALDQAVLRIADAVALVDTDAGSVFACQDCGTVLCAGHDDPKSGAAVRETAIDRLSPWNRFGLVGEIVVREFFCPACAHQLATQVRRKDDPILYDTVLADGRRAAPRAAAE